MKVAVLCGGRSYEREVSLRSGARVEEALRELGHEVDVIDTDPATSRTLAAGGYDCAFIALHGTGGEDGSIQELLELLGLPYTGSRPGPSQRAYDKARAKRTLIGAGQPTPEFVSLTSTALQEFGAADVLAEVSDTVGYPMVVKPASGGSALGIRFVADSADLPRALIAAMSYDKHVVLERYITGRELSVCIIGTDEPRALPAVGIEPRHAEYYDFESRYTPGETEFTCPASRISEAELARINEVSLASYAALDLSGFGRVDLIIDDEGTPWVLELNSIPGMTATSLLPLACEAAGLALTDVVAGLLEDAFDQHTVEIVQD